MNNIDPNNNSAAVKLSNSSDSITKMYGIDLVLKKLNEVFAPIEHESQYTWSHKNFLRNSYITSLQNMVLNDLKIMHTAGELGVRKTTLGFLGADLRMAIVATDFRKATANTHLLAIKTLHDLYGISYTEPRVLN